MTFVPVYIFILLYDKLMDVFLMLCVDVFEMYTRISLCNAVHNNTVLDATRFTNGYKNM